MDHDQRCLDNNETRTGFKRAYIAVETTRLDRTVIDVGTTNLVSNTAMKGQAATHLQKIEMAKTKRYSDYYNKFEPFIIAAEYQRPPFLP